MGGLLPSMRHFSDRQNFGQAARPVTCQPVCSCTFWLAGDFFPGRHLAAAGALAPTSPQPSKEKAGWHAARCCSRRWARQGRPCSDGEGMGGAGTGCKHLLHCQSPACTAGMPAACLIFLLCTWTPSFLSAFYIHTLALHACLSCPACGTVW